MVKVKIKTEDTFVKKVFKNSEIEIIKSGKRKEKYDPEVNMKELKALEEGFKMED